MAGGSSTGLPAPTLVDRPRLFRGWQNTHGDGRLIAGYDYHDQASYNEMAYANGLTTRLDYDTLGRTTRPSSAVADYRYGYDDAGNRIYMQRHDQPNQPADVYQYNDLYRFVKLLAGYS